MPAFLLPWCAGYRAEVSPTGRTEARLISQNRLHSGYILAEQENRLISQNRLDGGWMALPWLMPAAFECPVVIGDQGGNRTPDTRITNPLADVDSDFTLLLNTSDKKKSNKNALPCFWRPACKYADV